MEVAAGKAVLDCLLCGAKVAFDGDKASKQAVRRDLPFLKEELAAMQSFLLAADDERNKHKVPKAEVKRVRTLAYEVDDCIQNTIVHLEKPSWWQFPQTMRERQRIAEEMKTLRAQIEDMGQRSLRYHIAEDPNPRSAASSATISGNRARRAAATASDKPEVNRMVQLINTEDNDLQVIAVWGTSGNLGQTSIVREAYENPAVKDKFRCRAWVRVMQPFNPTEFVQSLVRQFHAAVGVDVLLEAEKTAQQLAQEFNNHVSENSYLIVLNDLNTIEEWDRIKTCFPNNKKGSRIIVSTKQAEVASLSVGYECAELKIKELAPDQILYAFHNKASQDGLSPVISLERYRTMVLSLEESYLVGRASEKEYIIRSVTSEDGEPGVFAVWGIRGVGKTTLVRDVYESQELNGTFHKMRAYVTIVHPIILDEILRSIFMQLDAGKPYENNDMVGLSGRTRKKILKMPFEEFTEELILLLNGTRCLIVLDNVSSTEDWDKIKGFMCTVRNNSSKIIVTTREEHIALHCSEKIAHIYKLDALHYEDGHYLFTRKVFGETILWDQQYPELVEQAELLLKRCDGLPLAIVTLGAFLANHPKTVLEWRELNKHISAAESDTNGDVGTIITLIPRKMYDDLPYTLRACVLYLPIFPKDYKVSRRRLIRRLCAEGFIRELGDKSVEETADTFFMELISRNMIVPCQLSIYSREGIKAFQVHDIISEMAILKAMEENFVSDRCRQSTQGTLGHLSVSSNWKGEEQPGSMRHLHSMTVFGKWRPFFSFDKMRFLRVLDLEDTSGLVDHHLEHIGKLMLLRYLSLRGCGDIYHLPDSLGNLRLLETLDVKGTKITRLPKTISKLWQLRHLVAGFAEDDDDNVYESMSEGLPKLLRNKLGLVTVFSAGFCVACCAPHRMKQRMEMDGDVNRRDVCTVCCCAMLPVLGIAGGGVAVPRRISKLKSLLTLGTVNVSAGWRKSALRDIAGFTGLRKLGVAGINRRNGRELCSAVSRLGCLESLSVRSDGKQGLVGCLDDIASPPQRLQSLKLYGRLVRLPKWVQRLDSLVKLKLRSSEICRHDDDAAIQVLGKLPKLAILRLLENSFKGKELHFSSWPDAFPSLLVLQIQSLDVVRMVEFEQGATPKLEQLMFGFGVPSAGDCRFSGLQYLLGLREVVFSSQGRYREYMTRDMRQQLAGNPNRPVLKIDN